MEVRQSHDCKLLALKVLESSGNPKFYSWAVSQLHDALVKAETPEARLEMPANELRSRWSLEEYLGNPRVRLRLIAVY